MYTPTQVRSQPGIKRDGTQFEGDYYTDGQWCRFQRGLPRKMGGYRNITPRLRQKVYGLSSFSADLLTYIACGEGDFLEQVTIDINGNATAIADRTPGGFVADPNNVWQFANLPSAVAEATDLIAHGAPNLADIASTVETQIWFGQADLATALVATGLDPQSGGACAIGPYLFGYGNAGFLQWAAPNDPLTFQNEARVTGQKIVYGRELRGGGNGPAGIFWSLDSVLRATFVAGVSDPSTDPVFAFDTLAGELSILSSRCVIEYDGVYYWWNVDRPLMFNGVVREVPNNMNLNYFLDGLNFAQRQKIYAYKVPRFGEIWWCYPRGNATECTHAVVLNVRENTWYDTQLPTSMRTSGIYASVYPKPFMADGTANSDNAFGLWQHETGVDEINGTQVEPIPSFFQTADISMMTLEKNPSNQSLSVAVLEPDFVQVGDMTVTVTGKANARAPVQESAAKTFPPDNGALDAAEQLVRFKEERRELRFRFDSNTPGGDYQMGQSLAHLLPSDSRLTS